MKILKIIGKTLRVLTLILLLNSIGLQWNKFLQYLFAIVAIMIWGASGYLEGLTDGEEE